MVKHTLYYSKRCRFSQAFLEELAGTPFVPEFQFVCVDPGPTRPALPGWLKSVPTLVVAGEASPRVGPGPVTNWLFERKMGGEPKRANVLEERTAPVYSPDVAPRPMPVISSNPRAPGASPMVAGGPPSRGDAPSAGGASSRSDAPSAGGPEAYHGAEMAGGRWSDAYSFVGDAFTAEKGYDPISRNFQSLVDVFAGGAAPGGGAVAAGAAAAPKQTAKEAALLKEYEAYTKARDADVGGPPKRI